MAKIEKTCLTCNNTFNADTREVNRGRAKYCSISCASKVTKDQQYNKICKHCGTNYTSASKASKYCSTSCKGKNYRLKSKDDSSEGVGIKQLYKIFTDKGCEICGWNETSCDIHHIIEVSNGGTNQLNNVVNVCPNHHRMIHKNLVSQDNLLKIVKDRTISSP